MEETDVVIYVYKVCTKFTKQNSSTSFLSFVFSVHQNTADCESGRIVMLLSLRIPSKKQKEFRKKFQSFGFTDK